MKAAFIGFVPPEKDDILSTLESHAKIGYKGFEGGDLLFAKGDPKENLKKVQSFGIEPTGLHYGEPGKANVPELIEKAHTVGVNKVLCYAGAVSMPRFMLSKEPLSKDAVLRELEIFDRDAAELKKEGIDLLFHNHHFEFLESIDGIPALYFMAAHTELLKFEVDCGWACYAGYDPVIVLRTLGSRVGAVHIKDFVDGTKIVKEDAAPMPNFTTVGTGKLPLSPVLEAAAELGMEYAVVEQDFQRNLSVHETLTAAYLNMKETGFVE